MLRLGSRLEGWHKQVQLGWAHKKAQRCGAGRWCRLVDPPHPNTRICSSSLLSATAVWRGLLQSAALTSTPHCKAMQLLRTLPL